MACSKPHAGNLRKGRYSQPGLYYFLTASVAGRRRIFANRHRAMLVLDAIRWLYAAIRTVTIAMVKSRLEAAPTGRGEMLLLRDLW